MCTKKSLKFTCSECGSDQLAYQKYVKCSTPVVLHENGNIEYGQSKFDEDDYLCADNHFICMDCGASVEHCGWRFETEKQLIDYLTMDPDVRNKEETEYSEHIDAQINAQEQADMEAFVELE